MGIHELTPNPSLNAGSLVQLLPSTTLPVGPAPPITAKDIMMIKMNKNALTKDPKY